MKVLYLNGADVEGGAAKAAMRLLDGVHNLGIDAHLTVQRKYGNHPLVEGPATICGRLSSRIRPTVEQLIVGINPRNLNGPFCAAYLPDRLVAQATTSAPDIIHLHWVARMMKLETLSRFNKPLVWTMHDSWAFTGGCYIPSDCTRYQEACGKCPVLGTDQASDLSNRIWQRKQKNWRDLNLTLIAPSNWMATCARASSLFCNSPIEVIPNGINTRLFAPCDQLIARNKLSLPQDKKLILFGAKGGTSDRNKGYHLLNEALHYLASSTALRDTTELLVFGSTGQNESQNPHFKTHHMGWQHDETNLALHYAAADVFVLPSLHESLGFTVMEAMACGTPVVSFNQGGVPDLVDHLHNGYLAPAYDPVELARGIAWTVEDHSRWRMLSAHAREKILRVFTIEKVAEQHVRLYESMLCGNLPVEI